MAHRRIAGKFCLGELVSRGIASLKAIGVSSTSSQTTRSISRFQSYVKAENVSRWVNAVLIEIPRKPRNFLASLATLQLS